MMQPTTAFLLFAAVSSLLLCDSVVNSFCTVTSTRNAPQRTESRLFADSSEEESSTSSSTTSSSTTTTAIEEVSRRQALALLATVTTAAALTIPTAPANAADTVEFKPANRPFAYRVDSTRPPTLLPLSGRQEQSILKGLGKGSGTGKASVVSDRITLNNMMNKGVFGAIGAAQTAMGTNEVTLSKQGTGFATFVAMSVPTEAAPEDIGLATSLLNFLMQGRKSKKAPTALGLPFAPLSTQAALTSFQTTGSMADVVAALTASGVPEATVELYKPLIEFAKTNSMDLLAMSPEIEDLRTVRADGLQNIDPDRRSQYVVDSEGFIALTQDPKFRLYTDRSLLKGFVPLSDKDTPANFFAERILAHETGATAVAKYATSRPESLVAYVAPIEDVRFVGGVNGRLPRVCQYINTVVNQNSNKVTEECVTTILLNPTATETLSLSRYLRLEIGTAPTNIEYQTKVADFLWFSKMPKVNMIPRLMNR